MKIASINILNTNNNYKKYQTNSNQPLKNNVSFKSIKDTFERKETRKIDLQKFNVIRNFKEKQIEASLIDSINLKNEVKSLENETKEITKDINDTENEISDILDTMEKMASEVSKTFKKGKALNRLVNENTMAEYKGGKLIRKTKFENGKVKSIEMHDNGIMRFEYQENEPSGYLKNYSVSNDGTKHCEKMISFEYGKPSVYCENMQIYPDSGYKYDKRLIFEGGVIKNFIKNAIKYPNETVEYGTRLDFKNGQKDTLAKNVTKTKAKDYSSFIELDFENGKPSEFLKDYKLSSDNKKAYKKGLLFDRKEVIEYQRAFEKSPNGDIKIARVLDFKDNKPTKYYVNYEEPASSIPTYEKRIKF